MDLATFEKQIKSKKLGYPVQIFAGPEAFLKEKAFNSIVEAFVPEEDRSDNVKRCDCKQLTDTYQSIYSFSFNTSPRVFYIQDIDSAPAKQRKDFIAQVSQNGIPPSVILIFAVSDSKTVTELAAKFKQQSERVDFWAPFANQLGAWVKKELAEQGAEISTEAVERLVDLVGSELSLLYQELTKLAIGHKGKKISLEEVNAAVAYVRQDSVFDFLDAFGHRDIVKTLRCLESLVNRGEAVPKIWFMLSRQIRGFRILHSLRQDRPDIFEPIFGILQKYRQIADKSDFKSNQTKKMLLSDIQQLSEQMPEALSKAADLKSLPKLKNMYLALNFTLPELIAVSKTMLYADKDFKSGIPDPLAALQVFIVNFLMPGENR